MKKPKDFMDKQSGYFRDLVQFAHLLGFLDYVLNEELISEEARENVSTIMYKLSGLEDFLHKELNDFKSEINDIEELRTNYPLDIAIMNSENEGFFE